MELKYPKYYKHIQDFLWSNKIILRFVKPKKGLGQHFLNDISVAERIVESLSPSQNVLEIGPGTGILTKILIKKKIIGIINNFYSLWVFLWNIKTQIQLH